MSAAHRWEAALAGWGLPEEIVTAAPADPWSLAPSDCRPADGVDPERRTPADEAARAALPRRGSVLDVGCGPGGTSAPLRDRAGLVTGIDDEATMLEAFAEVVGERPGLLDRLRGGAPTVRTVQGRWPAVAAAVRPADVVVCHNVLYNVGDDVTGFVSALTDHARERVVLALTTRHPRAWLAPYLEQLHGLMRPWEPTSDTAVDVVREVAGRRPTVTSWTAANDVDHEDDATVRRVARACAVGEDRLDEVRAALRRVPPPSVRQHTAIVWDGTAS